MNTLSLIALALAAQGLCATASQAALSPAQRAELRQDMAAAALNDEIYRVWFADPTTARQAAISLHDAVLESRWQQGVLVLELDAAQRARLAPHAFRIERANDFIGRRNRMLQALDALDEPALLGGPARARVALQGENPAIPNYSCYETVEETIAAAQGLVTAYPSLAAYSAVGSSWEKTQGKGGWDMNVLKLTNQATTGPNGEAKPKLFVNAAIHAREYATAPLVLAFAKQLLQGYGSDADATWILDHHEIHLMLHTNPDGRKKAETGLLWRKNTNQNYCGVNSNARGADLNRNFSYSWNITNGGGSSGNPCSETFRGSSASSEPETQSVEAYVRGLWPDRRGTGKNDPAPADTSGIHIDVHSYGKLVLWPWGFTNTPSGNHTALQTLGRRFAYYNGHYPEQSIGLYPTDGTSDSVSYGELGVAAYTFEIGNDFFQNCSTYENSIKPGNLKALLYAAKVVRAPYQLPTGPDALKLKLDQTKVPKGTPVTLSASLTAKRFSAANGVENALDIAGAEAFVDTPPWAPGATALPLAAVDGAFDSKAEAVSGVIATTGLSRGKHLLWVRGVAVGGQPGPVSATFLRVR